MHAQEIKIGINAKNVEEVRKKIRFLLLIIKYLLSYSKHVDN